jgi:CopG family transcriptional regulator / antitoxin EndoAI
MCMKTGVHKRLNITLPESTVVLLESVAAKGERSSVIDSAIRRYVTEMRIEDMREQLKAGAIANAERDLGIVREWDELGDESWPEY